MTGTNKMTDSIKTEFRHRGPLWIGVLFASIFGALGGYTVAAYYIGERASKEISNIRVAYNDAAKARMDQLQDVTGRLGQCLVITAKNGEAASSAANNAADAANSAASAANNAATALDKATGELPK